MGYAHDSSHPTGVVDTSDNNSNHGALVKARHRKANAALQMKLAGATWDEIAEVIGFPTARHAITAVEQSLERELQGDELSHKKMRQLAGKRLERLLRSCWAKAIDPEHPEHLQALTKAREIIDRHAKLYGLDAPTEMVVHSPTQYELEQWVATVAQGTQPQLEEYDILDAESEEIEENEDAESSAGA